MLEASQSRSPARDKRETPQHQQEKGGRFDTTLSLTRKDFWVHCQPVYRTWANSEKKNGPTFHHKRSFCQPRHGKKNRQEHQKITISIFWGGREVCSWILALPSWYIHNKHQVPDTSSKLLRFLQFFVLFQVLFDCFCFCLPEGLVVDGSVPRHVCHEVLQHLARHIGVA